MVSRTLLCTFKTNSIAKKMCFTGSFPAFTYEERVAAVGSLWLSGRSRGVQILDARCALDGRDALDGQDALDAWGTLDG